jgi:tetratricopeptide (TPR) repeat protein
MNEHEKIPHIKKMDIESISSKLRNILILSEEEEVAIQLTNLLDEEIFITDEIEKDHIKDLREVYISLKENLKFYQRALASEARGQPGSEHYVREMSFALQRSIQDTRFIVTALTKRKQDEKTAPSRRASQTGTTTLINPQTEDENIIKNFEERFKQNPNDDKLYNEFGNYYFSLERYEDARKEYLKALSKKRIDIYYLNIGDSYKKEKNWAMAIENYEQALLINQDNPITFDRLGEVYYLNENYDKAIEYGLKCMRFRNDYIDHVNVGSAYHKKKENDLATNYLDTALVMNPHCEVAHQELASVLMAEFKENGDESLVVKAIDHYKKILEFNPNSRIAYGLIGDAYIKLSNWDQATRYYSKALGLEENDDLSHSGLAYAYEKTGKLDESFNHHRKALELQPNSPLYLMRMGDYYRKKNEWNKAIEFYKKSLQEDPDNAITLNNLGFTYFSMRDYVNAQSYYERAINLDSTNSTFYNNLAILYSEIGKWEEARINYEAVLKLDPEDATAFGGLGTYYLESKYLFTKALDYFNRSFNLNPKDPYIISKISETYTRLENWDEALRYAELANEVSQTSSTPDDMYKKKIGDVHHSKGLYLYRQGLYQHAINEFIEANRFAEDDATYWSIYLSFLALENYNEARRNLLKAIDLKVSSKYTLALDELNTKMERSR